jgi:hypothetical protein
MALGRRGRKTDLNLVVIPGGGRPEPPADMPDDEAEVWRTIVDSMPARWFGPQNAHLLEQYCHVACAAEKTARETRRLLMTMENLSALSRLNAIGAKQTGMMVSLATRLRLTPQSAKHRLTAEAEIRNAPRLRPWED